MQTYLGRREAAEFLTENGCKTAPGTLAKLACIGGGPVYRRFGARVVYTRDDLTEWAESKLSEPRRSTSDVAA